MSFPKTLRPALSLALSLLWPAAAFAQAPADQPQVQIKVDFVTVGSADLSADLTKSGMNFDRVPLVTPGGTFTQPLTSLRYMAGDAATRLFQMLERAHSKSVQAPPVTTADGTPTTIQLQTQAAGPEKKSLTLQTRLTVTPRINTDDSITLFVGLQAADADAPPTGLRETTLRTVRSGDMMVVDGLPMGSDRTGATEKLLVFIQPTLVGAGTPASRLAAPLFPPQDTSLMLETSISVDVFNADLRTIVAMLERQSRLKASVQGSTYKPVYVHLHGAPLAEALGAVARSAGAQIIRDESGVYVFSPLPLTR